MMDDFILNVMIVLVLLVVAWHGLTTKDEAGQHPFVHLLFGSIALLFALRFLFLDVFS